MKIGLVIACDSEIDSLLNTLNLKDEHNELGFKVLEYEINNNSLYVCKSGYGMIASSAATELLISKYKVKIITNYGVVGALKSNLNYSSVCVVKDIVHPEFDVSSIDNVLKYTYSQYGYKTPFMETDKRLKEFALLHSPILKEARLVSSNKFIESKEEKEKLAKEFDADICDMEAVGIYLVSKINNVPSLFIKGISDLSDDSSSAKSFVKMVKLSSFTAFNIILEILKDLK